VTPKLHELNDRLNENQMLKIFISKSRKYKQEQKYENRNIFFFLFFFSLLQKENKTFEMLRHAEPDFSKEKCCAAEV